MAPRREQAETGDPRSIAPGGATAGVLETCIDLLVVGFAQGSYLHAAHAHPLDRERPGRDPDAGAAPGRGAGDAAGRER